MGCKIVFHGLICLNCVNTVKAETVRNKSKARNISKLNFVKGSHPLLNYLGNAKGRFGAEGKLDAKLTILLISQARLRCWHSAVWGQTALTFRVE